MSDDILYTFTGNIYHWAKFLLNFATEFSFDLYINLSELSIITGPTSAVPDFGHFQFLYVYKETQNLH